MDLVRCPATSRILLTASARTRFIAPDLRLGPHIGFGVTVVDFFVLERVVVGEHPFLGVLSRELCLQAVSAEFGIPSPKSSAELVIENVHPHLQ
jgi:hypothetical protein